MTNTSRVAVVTGASRGIGAAIATRLAAAQYVTIGLHRTVSPESAKVAAEIRSFDPRNRLLTCDTSEREDVRRTFDELLEDFGAVTDLVNCAGITSDSSLALMTGEQWDSVLAVNLTGVFNVTSQFAFPAMRNGVGVVTNISSIAGLQGNRGQANYAATKSGIDGFTRSLAKEMGPSHIRVNSVAPGFVETDMTASFSDRQRKQLLKNISLRRMGTPEDIAGVVSFLHSDEASYITGQTLVVDGGAVI